MAGVRVVTDSACDLPAELARDHRITIVPLTIRFGDEELTDGVELGAEEFWRRCRSTSALPETAAPSPGAFQAAYEAAADDGAEEVVCLTLSSGVSATYQSALAGAGAVGGRLPIEVVDTRSLTMGQGLLCLAAAELAAGGAGLGDIVAHVASLIERTRVYGVLGTLDHLQRGGRVGGAAALLGSLLSIKPVIQVAGGVVEQESKQRTRSRALEYLVAKCRADEPLERIALCDGASEDIEAVAEKLREVETAQPLVVTNLGPVVGTHAGPGSIGLCYQLPPAR